MRLLIFLLAILIPACASSSPVFLMIYSACKLNNQGDNIQPWHSPFPVWSWCVAPCPVLTVASWSAYRFLKRQVRWSGIPISLIIFHSLLCLPELNNVKVIFSQYLAHGRWKLTFVPCQCYVRVRPISRNWHDGGWQHQFRSLCNSQSTRSTLSAQRTTLVPAVSSISMNWIHLINSFVTQKVKRLSAMQETQVRSLVWEDLLEKEMAAHSSILA